MIRADDTQTEIVSVMPAAGWWTVFRDEAGEVREPVIALALVEYRWPGGSTRTLVPMVPEGMGAGVVLAEGSEYCGLVYVPPGGAPMPEWATDKAP